jgi:hypothetical protein
MDPGFRLPPTNICGHFLRKAPFCRALSKRHSAIGLWTVDFGLCPGKLAIAARLRSETTLPIKWIAARVQIGTAKETKSVLPHLAQSQDHRKTASALETCAQLEF